jgi:hypothetical protein
LTPKSIRKTPAKHTFEDDDASGPEDSEDLGESFVEDDNALSDNDQQEDPFSDGFEESAIPPHKTRRDSFLHKMVEAAEKPRHKVTYTRTQPAYDHIQLTEMKLRSVIKFVDDVNAYQVSHGITLPVASLISEKVRDDICAQHPGMTIVKFLSCKAKDVIRLIQEECRPISKLQFQEALKKHTYFDIPHNYVPTSSAFKPFRDALLSYRRKFLRAFEIMAQDNEENVPQCDDKEGGLIKIFVEKIPFSYGKKIINSWAKKRRFPDIYAFLKKFFAVVKEHYGAYEKSLLVSQHFEGTEIVAAGKPLVRPTQLSPSTSRFPSKIPSRTHRLSALDEDSVSSADPEDNAAATLVSTKATLDPPDEISDGEFNAAFQSALTVKDSKGPPNGCFQMLFNGTCAHTGDCSYSHDHATLHKCYLHYSELLNKSRYRNPPPASSTHILRKPGSLSHIVGPCADALVFADFPPNDAYNDKLADTVLNLVRSALPFSAIYTPVHREGHLLLAEGLSLPIPRVLFDSGALHGNYLSEDFVNSHIAHFHPYLKPCSAHVKLADNKTVIPLKLIAEIPTCFIGDDGVEHIANVCYCVFPTTGNDIIIGLPAIISNFSTLFVEMIEAAAATAANSLNALAAPSLNDNCSSSPSDLISPWTYAVEDEAPEDVLTPLPCSFSTALSYMEQSYEDSVAEYLSQLDSHVAPAFRETTDIVNLLKTVGVSVFVPANWSGINGIPPLELSWKEGLPTSMKPRARPVNPKLYQHARTEFDRLSQYFYEPSSSPIASCLVIAPKSTAPFIRFCGDYVSINRFIDTGHFPIPHVQRSLDKIIQFSVFVDLDLVNSFHQFLLGKDTSAKLSVQTPWGQVQPKFMPEGIGPASGILQKHMSEIFADFEEWSIVIFDNMLILAHDYADAYEKVQIIFQRCVDRNLFLKFSKSWFGFDSVLFFGYRCRHKTYELTVERKSALAAVPFPTSQKQMQSFLGAALFFKSFVPHFSTKTASLHDMTKSTFDWSQPESWPADYRAQFDQLKKDLQESLTLHYPDYTLPWILRTDASVLGVGVVLLQKAVDTDSGEPVLQLIACASEKFSPQATRWTTIEQEAYGIYFGVKHFAYYLHCKPFILETDHNNLVWIEASSVPKIIRWRVYLQSFNFLLRHIPGKLNLLADFLSRNPQDSSLNHLFHSVELLDEPSPLPAPPQSLLSQVHGGRMGHFGARKTWLLLNEHFPGHSIPYSFVADFVASCAVCQKDRLGMTATLVPFVRHLKPPERRSMVGVDTLTVTPADENGNSYLFVVVNHFTKFTGLYPSPTRDAVAAATALFQHFCHYGLVDSIISDPGSEFTNDILSHLHKWLGIRHVFSLVDRHESNGVEGTNKQILRHLKALVFDERNKHRWSHPTVLPIIQFILNDTDSSETGVKPFAAHFGSHDQRYFHLPDGEETTDMAHLPLYVQQLDQDLRALQTISQKFQQQLLAERLAPNHTPAHHQFQPGDFVLFQASDHMLPSKLSPRYSGPFEVISQDKNDVLCKHLVVGSVHTFHLERLKLFFGSRDDAFRTAMLDHDQHVVDRIISYLGDPLTRTSCDFEVVFADGTVLWLPYSKDIADTAAFETFVRSRPELFPLIYSAAIASRRVASLRQQVLESIQPGDRVFVHLRSFGQAWYRTLSLPDLAHIDYFLEHKYTSWSNRKHTRIKLLCILTEEEFEVDQVFVQCYGTLRSLDTSDTHVILTRKHALAHPDILPAPFRDKLLRKFRSFAAHDS